MEYVIGIFTAAIFFILGRQYEKKMVERRNKRFIEEHLKNLDRLINKIKNQQTDPITGTYNIQLLESALKKKDTKMHLNLETYLKIYKKEKMRYKKRGKFPFLFC